MKKRSTRLLSGFLAILMMLGMMAAIALPAAASDEISSIAITLPEQGGETLNLAAISVPTDAGYEVSYIEDFTHDGSFVSGFDCTLVAGERIFIQLRISATGDAEFAEDLTATVNGNPATISAFGPIGFKLNYEFDVSGIPIEELNLTYDPETLDLNVAWTEGEVNQRARNHCAITSAGASYDPGNSGLRKLVETNWHGIGNGSAQVSAETQYGLEYNLYPDENYDWPAAAKTDASYDPETYPITVKVNGVVRTDISVDYNDYWNNLAIYFPIETASTDPIVTKLDINEESCSVTKGDEATFTATVAGTVTDQSVIWSVEGAASANTTIDAAGKLTIGEDETAETIKVVAKATADPTKSDFITITILDQLPTIDSITIAPAAVTVYTGNSKIFSETVIGTQTDKRVTWSVEGATSANTTISSSGDLTVGDDETATTLTVRATSVADPTKSGTATVTVVQKIRITMLELTYDAAAIDLSTAWTEGEVNQRARNHSTTTTAGANYDPGNSGLRWLNDSSWIGIGGGSAQVSAEKQYGLEYFLWLEEEYDWPADAKTNAPYDPETYPITIKVNGVVCTDITIEYNAYWNSISIYVPISSTCIHTEFSGFGPHICGECGETVNPFTDVQAGAWYFDGVVYAYSNGYMSGTSPTIFAPNMQFTREQFVQLLFSMEGLDKADYQGDTGFSDVPAGQWYSAAVKWAKEEGITSGIREGVFGLGVQLSREQLAQFFKNYAEYCGEDTSARADLSTFEDAGQISGWAKEAVSWANAVGLLNSTSNTQMLLAPGRIAMRTEVARITMTFDDFRN